MPRLPVLTRPATRDDVPALAGLWRELRQVGGRAARVLNPMLGIDVAARLGQILDDPDSSVVVATADGVTVGMAVFSLGRLAPMSDVRAVQVHHLVVTTSHRRRGVGHALVAAALAYADEHCVEYVVVSAYASLRDVNRFYARLGFAPLVVRRVAPTAVLRRTLATTDMLGMRLDLMRRRARGRRAVPAQRAVAALPSDVDTEA